MIDYLNDIVPFGAELETYFSGSLQSGPWCKKCPLVLPGQKCDKIWFLRKGAFTIYATDGYGGRILTDIVIGPGILWLPEYSYKYCFSRHHIEVVSSCQVQWIHYGELAQELYKFKEFHDIETALIRIRSIANEEKFMMMREKIIAERYRRCLVLYPGIEDELNSLTIANFLNTSPETISRLRNR
jgi:CRP-like cAMP-binding protein